MAECILIETCIFFNDKMAKMPSTAEVYKKVYCRHDHANCARYMVYSAIGRESVPSDLFPNETQRAQNIIQEKK